MAILDFNHFSGVWLRGKTSEGNAHEQENLGTTADRRRRCDVCDAVHRLGSDGSVEARLLGSAGYGPDLEKLRRPVLARRLLDARDGDRRHRNADQDGIDRRTARWSKHQPRSQPVEGL